MKIAKPCEGKGLVLSGPSRKSKIMFGTPSVPETKGDVYKKWAIGNTLNQMQTSACVGFTWTQYLRSEPTKLSRNILIEDPFNYAFSLYREAQRRDPWPGEEPDYYGTTIEAGFEVLLERNKVDAELEWGLSVPQIVKHIIERGPVAFGTLWFRSMKMTRGRLRTVRVDTNSANEGGHAYLGFGVDTKRKLFFCVNSWGEVFGDKGVFTVTFKDMEKLLNLGGHACSATSL